MEVRLAGLNRLHELYGFVGWHGEGAEGDNLARLNVKVLVDEPDADIRDVMLG